MLKRVALMVGALVALSATSFAADPPAADRLAWFNDAKFGMFIHWGIYAVPAGEWEGKTNYAEWFQLQTNMPGAQYEKFAKDFTAAKFDAKQWAHIAKMAGMKYVVITSKHHDGFCMFDTKLTDYNIVKATPYAHDPMKELADAVRAEGMTFCFYYSVPDWHNRDFPAKYSQHATAEKPGFHGDPNPDADLNKYVDYVKGQLRELLTNYGPIGIIWFDGGGSFRVEGDKRAELMHAQELIDLIHVLQPNCLVNNRLGLPADYGTPEQRIPGGKSDTAFEVCMTLNKHWGFNKADNNWKDAKTVVHNLVDIASKGGNYLLNVGPTSEGVIPEPAVAILGDVGVWMGKYGNSIYGSSASPLDAPPAWGRITKKDKTVYLHVFDWPADGKISVKGLPGSAKKVYVVGDSDKSSLKFENSDGSLTITLPGSAPDAIDSVIAVESE
jgi:alpha-L-fucosidase